MLELSGTAYLWVKAFHVVAVMSWMAGLLYLPRLFVYHTQVEAGSEQSELFKVMERRLMKAIMNPAMIVSVILGLVLMSSYGPEIWQQGWFHAKLVMIVILMGSHIMMGKWRRAFEADENTKSHKFFRVANEVPTLLMIGIVIMVIVQPF